MPLDILTFGEAHADTLRKGGEPFDCSDALTGSIPDESFPAFALQAVRLGAQVGVIGTAPGHLSPEHLSESLLDGLKCLHLTGSALALNEKMLGLGLRALENTRNADVRVSFNPRLGRLTNSVEQARSTFQVFLKAADIILLTADEALLLTEAPTYNDAIRALLDHNMERAVIVKRGAEGCTTYQTHHTRDDMMYVHFVEGYDAEEIDPIDAGDCFDAGFLVRWLAGDDVMTAAMFANACGALAVTGDGSAVGAKTFDEVMSFMKARS